MDYRKLAQKHLEDAVSVGYLTLADGEVLPLKPSEILAVSKYILKEDLLASDEVDNATNFPSEMFMSAKDNEEESNE